jgi:hypothetical protein
MATGELIDARIKARMARTGETYQVAYHATLRWKTARSPGCTASSLTRCRPRGRRRGSAD